MSRYWMTQQWFAYLALAYSGITRAPWGIVALAAVWFLGVAFVFGRAAEKDDKRAGSVFLLNGPIR